MIAVELLGHKNQVCKSPCMVHPVLALEPFVLGTVCQEAFL